MKIEECVKDLESQIRIDKDFLWNHPEKGNEEYKTSDYIAKRLEDMGFYVEKNIVTTGILATLKGNNEGPCILFRSELDAIEMDETGRMKHTCGHDAHMTALLALAKLIVDNKERIKGTIKLAFEPAEETTGGAKFMIESGVLENPRVDYIFGIHFWSELKKGTYGIKPGAVMASTDPFDIIIHGKSGHGALPEKCVNPIYIANSIISRIQDIAAENHGLSDRIVLGITAIHGGITNNLIPETVEMKGICRTFNNEIRDSIKSKIKEAVADAANKMNGTAEVIFKEDCYPAVVNDADITKKVEEVAVDVLEKENIITDYQTMCSDDMAFFLQERPGVFILAGCTFAEYYPQHSENFCVDIETITDGVQFLFELVKKFNF